MGNVVTGGSGPVRVAFPSKVFEADVDVQAVCYPSSVVIATLITCAEAGRRGTAHRLGSGMSRAVLASSCPTSRWPPARRRRLLPPANRARHRLTAMTDRRRVLHAEHDRPRHEHAHVRRPGVLPPTRPPREPGRRRLYTGDQSGARAARERTRRHGRGGHVCGKEGRLAGQEGGDLSGGVRSPDPVLSVLLLIGW
jgi:hypothetical protein